MSIFSKDEQNLWVGTPLAQGPFQGLQGGGLAGLMVYELEKEAERQGLGVAVSASVEFHKPTANQPLHTEPRMVRKGRRVSFMTNAIVVDGAPTATSSVCFVQPAEMEDWPPTASTKFDPYVAKEVPQPKAPHGGPWMMDSFSLRHTADNSIIWFHQKVPLVDGITPLARVLVPADWTHGLRRPKTTGLIADPNLNLQVAVLRPPVGDHIGIRAKTNWQPSGIGLGEGELLDEQGPFGRVAMSVALTPMPGKAA